MAKGPLATILSWYLTYLVLASLALITIFTIEELMDVRSPIRKFVIENVLNIKRTNL